MRKYTTEWHRAELCTHLSMIVLTAAVLVVSSHLMRLGMPGLDYVPIVCLIFLIGHTTGAAWAVLGVIGYRRHVAAEVGRRMTELKASEARWRTPKNLTRS